MGTQSRLKWELNCSLSSRQPVSYTHLDVYKRQNLFQKEIIPVLKVFLEENKVLIKMDDTLSGCKNLAVEKFVRKGEE